MSRKTYDKASRHSIALNSALCAFLLPRQSASPKYTRFPVQVDGHCLLDYRVAKDGHLTFPAELRGGLKPLEGTLRIEERPVAFRVK